MAAVWACLASPRRVETRADSRAARPALCGRGTAPYKPTRPTRSCPLRALEGVPPIPTWAFPLSPGFHGTYLGGNYKDADDVLIALFICLGAEVTVFTLAIIIAMNTQ